MNQEPNWDYDVVIVGGGIAGLSTAWYLEKQARDAGRPLSYAVLERTAVWGGKIVTDAIDGFGDAPFVVEGGPDSFIRQKPWAEQLCHELGLTDRLVGTNDEKRKVYVLNRGKPTPLPDGVLLIVPTKFKPFVVSPLISPLGKMRMGMDLFIPAKRDGEDETLAEFIRRRLGNEALDKIAEPLMSGIYNAEADRQSLLATFPRFRALEEKYGSLTRGMLAARRASRQRAGSGNGKGPKSTFVTLRGGTREIIDALTAQLSGDLRLDAGVEKLESRDAGGYLLTLADGSCLRTRTVVLATPAFVAADLLRNVIPGAADGLSDIRYVSTGTITFGFRADEVSTRYAGFGLVVPRSERRPINAITWTSIKFDHRAPAGYTLLRVFFGGSRSPGSMDLDDEMLYATALDELRDLMGIDARPVFHRIYRWFRSNPQYDVGHLDRVAAIEAALPPGLHVTGSPYRGVGLPDCVKQAGQTADAVWAGLSGLSIGQV